MSATKRAVDQYNRPIYTDNEIPPADQGFAVWRGRITHPDAVATLLMKEHRVACVGGWIESGNWWLHCGVCRPEGGQQ